MVGQHISKYRVTEQIGRGGMGTVYRAIDETLHREVAIKVLNTELNDPSVARRFRAEAVTVARLNHPGIATIYELVQHDGQWLMVMEFVRGETLEHLAARQGPLPVERAADLCMQTLSALAHAHGLGVVHRDLKPANLMVTDAGSVKVMDFGIARVAGTEHLTSAGFMMGTPAYMAPEQVLGQEIDARTDLYATGVVLYHLATGKLPFKGDTPLEMAQSRIRDQPTPVRMVRSELPQWLGQVLEISLDRDPTRRFQTALLFRDALRRGLSNLPIETPVPSAIPPELVATAAPRSLPIVVAADTPVEVPVPRSTSPPAADMPTVATAVPSTVAAASNPRPSSPRTWMGIAAAVLLLAIAGGVWWSRREAQPNASGSAVPVAPPAALPSAESTAGDSPSSTVIADRAAASDAGRVAASAVATPVAAPPAAPAPAVTTTAATGSATADGRAAGSPTAATRGTAAARGRGRGAATAPDDPLIAFADLRAFVVNGKKAEEQPAVLRFQAGQVTLAADKGDKVFATLSYKDLTSAVFTRAKNPRWFPTLAGPPSDVDMPGGLFRSSRGWLALQTRAEFLIVRLNDTDLRKVLDTVTERTGIQVEQLASQ